LNYLMLFIKYVELFIDAQPNALTKMTPLWLLKSIPTIKKLNMGVSKLGRQGWQLNAAAILVVYSPYQLAMMWGVHLITDFTPHISWL
jgi:hypothetical protein